MEVMRLDDLAYIMDEQLQSSLDENQKMAIQAVLEVKNMIMYKDI